MIGFPKKLTSKLVTATLISIGAAGAVAAVGAALGSDEAAAATACCGNLRAIAVNEDRFSNYDYTDQATNSVDWPVTAVYVINAEIDKVKDGICSVSTACAQGGPMSEWVDEGYGAWYLDQDSGSKGPCATFGDTYHTRLYADGDDRLNNTQFGFYIVGTTHIDHNECNAFGRWFGHSEETEGVFASYARAKWGSAQVVEDWWWIWNGEPYRQEGNHYWDNNGAATGVWVY